MRQVSMFALEGIPSVFARMDLAGEILTAATRSDFSFRDGDIVVVAQKIVSKAEGRLVRLSNVVPSPRANDLSAQTGKDARLAELVLSESNEVLRARMNVLIVEHRLGHIMANAGIDRSNLDTAIDDEDIVLLLPENPDQSARQLRTKLESETDVRIGVVISDSFGRPWRIGTVGVAIGVAGPPAVDDRRGRPDLFGRALQVTETGFADALAAAGVLMMGEGDEGCPVVIIRGCSWNESDQGARDGLRCRSGDLFR